jgi:hypothetical protein
MRLLSILGGEFVAKVGIYEAWQLPLTVLMILTAVLITKYPIGLFTRFENLVSRIADRPYLSAALIAGAATCARLALSPFLGTPEPIAADEASLMLQAKTYLAGHLANHVTLLPDFESVYVLLSPTYASMYPVLRSLPILIGLLLGIGAWGGVLLSMVALTVAVYWMVREWINAKYAFIAALIVIVRYGLFSFWVNSYWGAALTALGGVLLLGGFKALRSRPNLLNGGLVGLGVFILMTTRPYEGMFYAVPFGVALAVQFILSTTLQRKLLVPPGLAAAVLVAAGFGLTLAHNEAVTRDWKVAPYLLYRQTVGQVPILLIESPSPQRERQVRYAVTRADLYFETPNYNRRATWAGILSAEAFRLRNYWNFYVGFALLIPFVVGIYALRGQATVSLATASLGLGLSLGTFDFAHYAAPGFGFVMLAIMAGFQSLRQWRPWGYPFGLSLSRVLPLALVLGSVIPLSSAFTGRPTYTMFVNTHFSTPCCWLRPRSFHMNVADEVDRYEGRNLVIVDTGPKAPTEERLVWNDADVDDEKTIWINDDAEFNRLAIERYPDRLIWRLGWLDDGAACLQLFQTVSSLADAVPEIGRLSGDEKRGWSPGSPDRCAGGLIHAPFFEMK